MPDTSKYPSLGGVTIPDTARLTWTQTREVSDGMARIEYSDGSVEVQAGPWTSARKVITIAGSGWAPPGIAALSRTTTHTLKWVELTAESTWTTRTSTVWIWEPLRVTDDPRVPGGGSSSWTITLREA